MPRFPVAGMGVALVVFVLLAASLAVVALAPTSAALAPSGRGAQASAALVIHPQGKSFAVTFSEDGLPAGETFQVMLGHSSSSIETDGSTDEIGFFVMNGSYSYTIDAVSGWHQSTLPYHGTLVVNGAAVNEPTLAYVQVTYAVTFSESGLPSGETFSVTLNNSPASLTTDGGTDSLSFSVPNYTYAYSIGGISGWHQSTLAYSGHVTVSGAGVTEPTLAYGQVTYSVSFPESGLPSGKSYAVTFDGIPKSLTTNGGTDTLSWSGIPNGTFSYAITGTPGWHQTTIPYAGSVTVAGASVAQPTQTYSKYVFYVVFAESGLPIGQTFKVTLGASVQSVVTDGLTDSLLFTETNGTYAYAVAGVQGWHQSSLAYSGSVDVSGAGVTEPTLVFSVVAYSVEFVETGLPVHTNWSVTFNGSTERTNTTSLGFTDPNGTLAYRIGIVGGWAVTPESGFVDVNGAAVVVAVPFHLVTFTVTFEESGLPSGSYWSVTANGTSRSSTTDAIVFQLPNGTFGYFVPGVPGYVPTVGSGSVTVANASTSIAVTFQLVTYTLTFTETGLTSKVLAKGWSVSLNGVLVSTTTDVIQFTVGNDSYTYLVRGPAGYVVSSILPPEGTVVVHGADVPVSVSFLKGPTGEAVFKETGLGTGTKWCVLLGASVCSTTDKIVSRNLTPGTYAYSIESFGGMTTLVKLAKVAVGASGSFALSKLSAFAIEYTWAVTFVEHGLNAGTAWTVSAGGQSVTSTTDSLVLYLRNGTYTFHVGKVTGEVASPAHGAFAVDGQSVSISIRFTAAPHH